MAAEADACLPAFCIDKRRRRPLSHAATRLCLSPSPLTFSGLFFSSHPLSTTSSRRWHCGRHQRSGAFNVNVAQPHQHQHGVQGRLQVLGAHAGQCAIALRPARSPRCFSPRARVRGPRSASRGPAPLRHQAPLAAPLSTPHINAPSISATGVPAHAAVHRGRDEAQRSAGGVPRPRRLDCRHACAAVLQRVPCRKWPGGASPLPTFRAPQRRNRTAPHRATPLPAAHTSQPLWAIFAFRRRASTASPTSSRRTSRKRSCLTTRPCLCSRCAPALRNRHP